MEESSSSIPVFTAPTLCDACFKHVNESDLFCEGCGYPLKGSEKDQSHFISVRNAKEFDLEEAGKKIKRAGNMLFWISGATFLYGLIIYYNNSSRTALNSNFILALIYIALAVWSRKKPLAAIISGFSLYVLVFLLNIVLSPTTLLNGILIKFIFIAYFIRGIKSAIEAEKLKKELNIE